MLAFDDSADVNTNLTQMTKAFERVSSGSVTFAARDSELDGQKIKKNEVLALDNGKLSFTEKDVNKAAYKLTKKLIRNDSSYVTLIYGADVTEEKAQQHRERVRGEDAEKPPAIEVQRRGMFPQSEMYPGIGKRQQKTRDHEQYVHQDIAVPDRLLQIHVEFTDAEPGVEPALLPDMIPAEKADGENTQKVGGGKISPVLP